MSIILSSGFIRLTKTKDFDKFIEQRHFHFRPEPNYPILIKPSQERS